MPLAEPFLTLPAFRPHPLVPGGHLQTIMGNYLPSGIAPPGVEHHVPLPDGDHIVLHDDGPLPLPLREGGGEGLMFGHSGHQDPLPNPLPVGEGTGAPQTRVDPPHSLLGNGQPVAILLHGLGGCHQSTYMQRCSVKLRARGVRVFRMDLRGCGAGLALARHPIHAGRSDDAAAALDYVSRQCPGSPIHLVGFSMGANIVLKLAGELGDQAPPHLASVMAVGPPIDLVECAKNMQLGWNRYYDRRFVRNLVRYIQRRNEVRPDALARPLVPRPRRLVDFDAMFTAPLSGFADTHDYYTQASSGRLLPRIAVPTLIVTAASDPIVPVGPFERASYSSTTQLVITPCGGHLGYVAARGLDPDHRWLDWRIVDWVTAQAATGTKQRANESVGINNQQCAGARVAEAC